MPLSNLSSHEEEMCLVLVAMLRKEPILYEVYPSKWVRMEGRYCHFGDIKLSGNYKLIENETC